MPRRPRASLEQFRKLGRIDAAAQGRVSGGHGAFHRQAARQVDDRTSEAGDP